MLCTDWTFGAIGYVNVDTSILNPPLFEKLS